MSARFTSRHKNENVYNLFSTELSVTNTDDMPVFLHEYYHHIQNTTTILGAERFNFFIQSLAHIAGLAKESKIFHLPLERWIEKKTIPNPIAKRLLEIYEHKLMWDYLEKRDDILSNLPEKFKAKHKSMTIVKIDYLGENEYLPTPMLVMQEKDGLKGYLIGGHFVAESGAFGLEQFHSTTPYPTDQLLSDPKWYPYHSLQTVLRKRIADARLVHLAAFLVSDLALILSTPSMGLQRILGYANELNSRMTANDLIDWYLSTYHELKDDITNAFLLEKEQLSKTKDELHDFDGILSQTINKHIEQIIKGLDTRLQQPGYYIRSLTTEFSKHRLIELWDKNPASKIQIGFDAPIFDSQNAFDTYSILSGLMDYYISIEKNPFALLPDEISEKYDLPLNNYNLDFQKVNKRTNSFVIRSKVDADETTDLHGYLLRWLGLDGKKIRYIGK